MSQFVKLTGAYPDERAIWVNLDLVRRMQRRAAHPGSETWPSAPERTVLWFDQSGPRNDDWDFEEVLETPDEILSLATPEAST